MEFPPTYVSFTIPSGATSGARITINEDGSGEIRVYDSTGCLVDIIGGTNGDIISKSCSTVGEVIVSQGVITIKNQGATEQATLFVPGISDPRGSLLIDSGYTGGGTTDESVGVLLAAGDSAFPIGDVDNMPHVYVYNRTQAPSAPVVPAYIGVSGAVVKLDENTNLPVAKATATINAAGNWAQGASIAGSYGPLTWWYNGLDDIHLMGVFHATAAGPSTIIATGLPAANMTNLGGVAIVGAASRISGGTGTMGLYLNSSGELRSNGGLVVANGDSFTINATIPLGNIP